MNLCEPVKRSRTTERVLKAASLALVACAQMMTRAYGEPKDVPAKSSSPAAAQTAAASPKPGQPIKAVKDSIDGQPAKPAGKAATPADLKKASKEEAASKNAKETKGAIQAKEVKEAKATGETKAGSEAKDAKEAKGTNEAKGVKDAKKAEDTKEAKGVKDVKDKDTKEAKVGTETKGSKEATESKEPKKAGDSKETKESKGIKESKDNKSSGANTAHTAANKGSLKGSEKVVEKNHAHALLVPPPPPDTPTLMLAPGDDMAEYSPLQFIPPELLSQRKLELQAQLADAKSDLQQKQNDAQSIKDRAVQFKSLLDEGVVSRREYETATKEAGEIDSQMGRLKLRVSELQTLLSGVDNRIKAFEKKKQPTTHTKQSVGKRLSAKGNRIH